jgi:DNA repair protein RAD16
MQHVSCRHGLPTFLISVIQTCFWNNEILTPIQKHSLDGPGKIAFKKLRILLDRMMLRRTKVKTSTPSHCVLEI